MKRTILFSFSLILFSTCMYAQKQMDWWYFGSNAGLNFSQLQTVNGVADMPTPVSGPINTWEGCFTVSDSDGNFLFASDGSTVYNKTTAIMSNGTGLKGNSDAAQSGIVFPVPDSNTQHYIVTVDRGNETDGINYSIVDMTLDNGNGAITATKNINLFSGPGQGYVDENIAAVRHANRRDYWLIHKQGQTFYVWKVTPSGIEAAQTYNFPSISPCGTSGEYIVSKLTFSPDNSKFTCSYYMCNTVFTGSFDNSTGVVSDVMSRTGLSWAYAAEFSASGEYVYIGSLNYNTYKCRYEDLRNGGPVTPLGISADNFQIGPDKRIYGVQRSTKMLFVIMNPDEGGTDIKTFNNYLVSNAGIGLPNFMASWWRIEDIVADPELPACKGEEITFTAKINSSSTLSEVAKIVWSFGDGNIATEENITSTLVQTHTYALGGTYTLTLIPYDENDEMLSDMIKTMEVKISPCIIPVNPNIHLSR